MSSIVCDIGGTKMRMAYSASGADFEKPLVEKTPALFEDGIRLLEEMARTVAKKRAVRRMIVGAPGVFDPQLKEFSWSPNLPDWQWKPVQKRLEERIAPLVTIVNDASLVGLGEAVYGAGKGFGIVVYITVSTGVGGARIVKGCIDPSAIGCEPGHQIIDISSGKTLEEAVGGGAIAKRFGKKPYEIRDDVLWKDLARILAMGVHNSILHWSPDALVFGGPMVLGDPAISLKDIERELKLRMKVFPRLPRILPAALRDVGGLYGGLALLSATR